jgi:hypothetical protein
MGRNVDIIRSALRHANPHPHALLTEALVHAGFEGGQFAARALRGEWQTPSKKGFLIRGVRASRWESARNRRKGSWDALGYRMYVDHAGPGRKAAVEAYAATLRRSGLRVAVGPLIRGLYRPGKAKLVVYLSGIYDHRGFLIAGDQPRAERTP